MQVIILNNSAIDSDVEDHNTFIENMLVEHNRIRFLHSAEPLVLNKSLCTSAQNWADDLLSISPLQNSPFTAKYQIGENIGLLEKNDAFPSITALRMVQSWYKDSFHYDFQTGEGHRGNFTQMVWLSTKSVGFGRSRNKDKCVVVAHYYPGGNMHGAYLSNVRPMRSDKENISANNIEIEECEGFSNPPSSPMPTLDNRIEHYKPSHVDSIINLSNSTENIQECGINTDAYIFVKAYLKNLKIDPKDKEIHHMYKLFERYSKKGMCIRKTALVNINKNVNVIQFPINTTKPNYSTNPNPDRNICKRTKLLTHTNPNHCLNSKDIDCGFTRIMDKNCGNIDENLDETCFYLHKQRKNIRMRRQSYFQDIKVRKFNEIKPPISSSLNNVTRSDKPITDKLFTSPKNIFSKRAKEHVMTAEEREYKRRIIKIRRTLLSAKDSDKVKFCNKPTCAQPRTRPKCMQPPTDTNDCGDESFFQEILHQHNSFRAKHNVKPLALDKNLNKLAGKWANFLSSKLFVMSSNINYLGERVGENIVSRIYFHNNCPSASEIVTDWYKQGRKYDYNVEPSVKGSYGSFTQIVWRGSQLLGIGKLEQNLIKGFKRVIVVCYYFPGGNVLANFKQNVPKPLKNVKFKSDGDRTNHFCEIKT